MKFKQFTSLFILLLFSLIACSHNRGTLHKANNDRMTSRNSPLAYDDSALGLKNTIEKINFNVRITIDSIKSPYILKSYSLKNIESIYTISNISGTTIYHAHISRFGKITKTKIVKSAGLGLDAITYKILKGLTIAPIYYQGRKFKSKVFIRIEIKGAEEI